MVFGYFLVRISVLILICRLILLYWFGVYGKVMLIGKLQLFSICVFVVYCIESIVLNGLVRVLLLMLVGWVMIESCVICVLRVLVFCLILVCVCLILVCVCWVCNWVCCVCNCLVCLLVFLCCWLISWVMCLLMVVLRVGRKVLVNGMLQFKVLIIWK